MRVLLAPTGFGPALGPARAAATLAEGWRRAAPDDVLDLAPLSGGGPGLLDALAAALPGARRHELVVEDPLARPVQAALLVDGTTAWVEAAQACGPALLAEAELDPLRTTTYGVGQLVRAALDAGARRVVVGLGASAAFDGGAGLLAALGVRRSDADGTRLAPGGGALRELAGLSGAPDPRLADVELVLATASDAPLLGLFGAAVTAGPAAGANREQIALLDGALTRWADALEPHLGVAVRDLPGAGADGGLGAALLALGAVREPDLDLVLQVARLAERVTAADLVVTGEAVLDLASLTGGVVGRLAALAGAHALPCVVLAGEVRIGRREAGAAGIETAWSLADAGAVPPDPAAALSALAARVAAQWSPARR